MESRLRQELSTTEVRPLSKAPNPPLLPGQTPTAPSVCALTKMSFIKEESEDVKNEVKHEDTEEQTGLFHSQNLSSVINLFIVFTICNSERN